ncbi:MAG: PspC domain-containing protein [Candidatus Marinimicrobia bacterium]|jgi:phage shock protein PspC (stress-responsive transcriptional regulator)|nr:PspC domain-containing protein [Candidatus Neomarinimicrobiota bacterium]MBT6952857.1 PspC domain-containing protein [Flavobacteriaceae bacterium]MBT5097098.1 PspC domain-containing protein [Candidatus Neomarinimicrobiota bacterium]MBT5440304.1 PspC domain-containing protein [Candidatus Neomarinimicrobiota bacterium]MBT6711539.1 PspC domain-containing protein [Candidatus Neomarinimicrobiota bacterium]|tara:strand:+ start:822 stop:2480 length:1659 start_codon:yes stop_codon:yes gene_type:complete
MKKSNTINLGGIIFHVDEDAFTQLQNYLNTIRSYFSKSDGQEEIIADIESRIAEIFQEKKISIITLTNVDNVIEIMGKPEDYDESQNDEKNPKLLVKEQKTRKVFRHPDEKIIGGVCGGLGAYFNVDPLLFRLGFLLTMFIGGFGIFVYLILWIIAPLADRASDYLEMHGEPVTAGTIGRAVASKIEDTVTNKNNQSIVRKILAVVGTIFGFFIEVFKRIIIVLGKIIKPLIGIIFLILGFAAAIGVSFFIIASFSGVEHEFQEITNTFNSILENFPLYRTFVFLALILFIGIPLFQIIYLGVRMLFNMVKQSSALKSSLLGIWVVGLTITIFFGIYGITHFSKDSRIEQLTTLENVKSDTLKIFLTSHDNFYWDEKNLNVVETEDGEHKLISNVEMGVARSHDSQYHLKIIKRASARSFKEARGSVENILYQYSVDSEHVQLDQYFKISSHYPYQKQSIELILFVPTGKAVYLDESLKYFIYDIKNTTNTHDYKMVGHNWTMGDDGLFNEFFKNKSSMNKTKKIKFIEFGDEDEDAMEELEIQKKVLIEKQ